MPDILRFISLIIMGGFVFFSTPQALAIDYLNEANTIQSQINSVYGARPTETVFAKVDNFTTYFLLFTTLVGIIMIVAAGYRYATAAGDKEKVEKGKKMLIWAVVGLVVAGLAKAIVLVIIQVISFGPGGVVSGGPPPPGGTSTPTPISYSVNQCGGIVNDGSGNPYTCSPTTSCPSPSQVCSGGFCYALESGSPFCVSNGPCTNIIYPTCVLTRDF